MDLIKTTTIVSHFIKSAMNCSFQKSLLVLAFPFLPLLLCISLPPPFPTPLPLPSLLPLSDQCICESLPHFPSQKGRSPLLVQCIGMIQKKKPNHWRWPKNALPVLSPASVHWRHYSCVVPFSGREAKRRPLHLTTTCIMSKSWSQKLVI